MGEHRQDATGHPSTRRVSVDEAARHLGVTVDAIRKRIARGTIPHERGEHGRVWVILDTDQESASNVQDTDRPQSEPDALISEMRRRIHDLRSQLEAERQAHAEARRIIAGLVERIPPAIEAPTETATDEPEGAEPRSAAGEAQDGGGTPSPLRGWYVAVLVTAISLASFGIAMYLVFVLLS